MRSILPPPGRVRFEPDTVVAIVVAALSSLCLLAGCVTAAMQETARTAPPGGFEGGASLNPVYIPFDSAAGKPQVTPAYECYGKVGLSDNSDLGCRLGNGSVGLSGKYRLLSGGVEVAARLGASAGFTLAGSLLGNLRPVIGWWTASSSVIASHEPTSGLPWAFSAGLDYSVLTYEIGEAPVGADWLDLKAGAGIPFRVGRSLRLMPEAGIVLPQAGSLRRSSDTDFLPGVRPMLTLGITLAAVNQNYSMH